MLNGTTTIVAFTFTLFSAFERPWHLIVMDHQESHDSESQDCQESCGLIGQSPMNNIRSELTNIACIDLGGFHGPCVMSWYPYLIYHT
jgi:hypothetical protein